MAMEKRPSKQVILPSSDDSTQYKTPNPQQPKTPTTQNAKTPTPQTPINPSLRLHFLILSIDYYPLLSV